MPAALAGIMARQRPDALTTGPESCLLVSGIVIESLKKPTAAVGKKLSGEARLHALREGIVGGHFPDRESLCILAEKRALRQLARYNTRLV